MNLKNYKGNIYIAMHMIIYAVSTYMSFIFIICALYLGKTNFKYYFTGFAILGCLAAIYIIYVFKTDK